MSTEAGVQPSSALGTSVEPDLGPNQPELVPQIDEEGRETDSSHAQSISAASTSLASSLYRYQVENGRTYTRFGKKEYWLSNDEDAQDFIDFTHHIYTYGFRGRLWLAPIKEPKNILDIGCGTGIWAIQAGEEQPQATVKGVDLSPIQPGWVPPNVKFEVDDYNEDWPSTQYDLIHGRELLGSTDDWPALYRKIFHALEPGGWLEHVETHYFESQATQNLPADHPYSLVVATYDEVARKSGLPFLICPNMKEWMESAGFVHVTLEKLPFPVGGWPRDRFLKDLGRMNLLRCDIGCQEWYPRTLTNVMGFRPEEVQTWIANLRNAFRRKEEQPIMYCYVVYGQRPISTE